MAIDARPDGDQDVATDYTQRVRVAGFGDRFEHGRANPLLEQYVSA